ncbi:hypothetical protein MRB53_039620 [Persea americana]|nr:hypothetical protein MRB53_039620 [Persea americana]
MLNADVEKRQHCAQSTTSCITPLGHHIYINFSQQLAYLEHQNDSQAARECSIAISEKPLAPHVSIALKCYLRLGYHSFRRDLEFNVMQSLDILTRLDALL